MVLFMMTEERKNLIFTNLLSERYHKLLSEPETRDEKKFEEIEYLYHLYERKNNENKKERINGR